MSDRKLAHVEKIVSLSPIEGADRIEVATVLGWQCVVKKGEFNVNDKVIYIEVDSIVPPKPEFEFLKDRKYRVRTIKLRKQISQGLVLPLSTLAKSYYKEGEDVTELLGIIKYDPQAQKEAMEQDVRLKNPIVKFMSRYKWFRNIFLKRASGGFPSWIRKTDEERIQNMPQVFQEEYRNLFSVTEKLDGQSATYFLKRRLNKSWIGDKYLYEFGVCSRNLRRGKPDNSSYWTIARKYNIERVLADISVKENLEYLVLQGEIIGESIQANKYKVSGYDFYAYNLVTPKGRLDTEVARDVLDEFDIKTVPLIDIIQLPSNIEELVKMSVGMSSLKNDTMREGLVFRSLRNNEISFKVINPDFLLKNGE